MTDQSYSGITTHLGIRFATADRFEAPVLVSYDPAATLGEAGPMARRCPG